MRISLKVLLFFCLNESAFASRLESIADEFKRYVIQHELSEGLDDEALSAYIDRSAETQFFSAYFDNCADFSSAETLNVFYDSVKARCDYT